MRIDIITPAYDVAPYIGDAIRSVLAQSHRYWTMTIVDDGSTDETAAIAATFDDPRIRLLRQRNAGVSAARNLGLVASNAEAVLFLDADDWLSPDALATLAETLRTAPNAIAAVGPYQRVLDGPGPLAAATGAVSDGRVRAPASGDLLRALLVRNQFANGGHLLIRRHKVETAGTFNPGLTYGEDWEYWIRLACFGVVRRNRWASAGAVRTGAIGQRVPRHGASPRRICSLHGGGVQHARAAGPVQRGRTGRSAAAGRGGE